MASCFSSLICFSILCLFLFSVSSSAEKTSYRPKVLLLQVTKDAKTLQYVTQVSQRTPLISLKLTLDLGGDYIWVNCDPTYSAPDRPTYISTTYRPAPCGSTPCKQLNTPFCVTCFLPGPPSPRCTNDTCTHDAKNSVTDNKDFGPVGSDVLAIHASNGRKVLGVVIIPEFIFVCGSNNIIPGLASGVKGMAGLGRTQVSLPAQLSSYFRFDRKFALCLSSSTRSNGVVFFGNGPYIFLPNVDVSSSLTYTPLIINPVTESSPPGVDGSPKYFIGVKSIKINEKPVKFNKTLLSIDAEGYGGTTISTVHPYTVLESSIYSAVVEAFVKAMPKNIKKVPSVAPFGACFSSKNVASTRLGPGVPYIDLGLQSKSVYWRIFGYNSMVEVKKNVLCLGFVEALDTYSRPRFSIVIGGHQIEENPLEFDLSASRLGFSSSLLGRSTACSNFNFTKSS